MSMRALLLAVSADLVANVTFGSTSAANIISIGPDADPDPADGEMSVVVWPGPWDVTPANADLDEEYGINVTVTRRGCFSPKDRQDTAFLTGTAALDLLRVVEAIRVRVHMSYAILNAANTTIGAGENGFLEPLRLRRIDGPRKVTGAWFEADEREANAGFTYTLSFGGARRLQVLSEMS